MKVDVERLRDLAGKATPGPYGMVGVPYRDYWVVPADNVSGFGSKRVIAAFERSGSAEYPHFSGDQREANALYFTACDPQTIISLCDRVKALEEALTDSNVQIARAMDGFDEGRPMHTALGKCLSVNYALLSEREG